MRSYLGRMILSVVLCVCVFVGMGLLGGCLFDNDDDGEALFNSSRAYQGHESDADINNFILTYQDAYGTRLDDCQTCHKAATVRDDDDDPYEANPCDYCHFIIHPPEDWTQLPTGYEQTLNAYGLAYKNAGEDRAAIAAIADEDSDGDTFTNAEEIADLRYPGDAGSYPGLPLAPVITVTRDELLAMPAHTQFGLSNANKQQFDYYATYTGVKIIDILTAKGIDLTGATGIDIMAPDGYAKSFSIEQITGQYPDHRFFSGFGVESLGSSCAFVEYPAETYGLSYGDYIGAELGQEFWHIIAYSREGQNLETAYPDPTTGRIVGEGPYRNIVPPGSDNNDYNIPDRGKYEDTTGCTLPEWDYIDNVDHNAGAMVKATVIIKIFPMPAGYEEFDIVNGGWSMVNAGELLIYGNGVQ
ncbi:MAG: hypothetical protein GY835_27440 [bacterium]|nr:hypothetical protein [bacterium]